MSRDRLIDGLWGERPPENAVKAVQVYVSHLRKLLSDGLLETQAPGYVLRVDPERVDVLSFERLVRERRYEAALALWRGSPLAEFASEPFAQGEIGRLEELRLAALEERIELDLAQGRHAELIGELEQLIAQQPLRERLRGQLMLALYRSGRQAEALEAYQRFRRTLVDELGIEPGQSLRDLELSILRQDPVLDPRLLEEPLDEVPSSSFVGREHELAALDGGLEDARRGRGGLYLLTGEPGIGKSRLAAEFTARAQARGAEVLVGRCWEAGGAPAFWPWIQSLRAYVSRCPPERLRDELATTGRDLGQLLPEIRAVIPDVSEPAATESEGARLRLFDAVSSFLAAAARTRPLVLVLDDLHVADEPSLLLLRFLARQLGQSRVVVVGAYRDVDPTVADPLAQTLLELAREPVTHRFTLGGLDAGAVAQYIELTTGERPHARAVSRIHAETEGNPLFVDEVVRLRAAEGGGLGSGDLPQLVVPEGVREVISRRLSHLSAQCQQALARASVLGREFDVADLEHLSGTSGDDLLELLEEGISARVLSDVPGTGARMRFAHALIREVLYDGLSNVRRAQLHHQVGETLEAGYQDDLEPRLSQLAYHFSEGASRGEPEKALRYAMRAGDRALGIFAYEEAARLYRMALTLAQDDVERCDLLLSLGDAQARSGDSSSARATFRDAVERADRLGLPSHLARAALGYGGRFIWDMSRDDEHLGPLLERALAALGDADDPLHVRLLARLAGGPLRDSTADPQRRRLLSVQALEMARRIGDPSTLAYALEGYIVTHHSPDFTSEQVDVATELIQVAQEAGEVERVVDGFEARLTASMELGDLSSASADLDAMAALAEELRQPAQRWLVATYRAGFALFEGRFEEAEQLIAETRSMGEEALGWMATVVHAMQLYLLRRGQGRLAEVEQMVRESVEAYPTYTLWRPVRVQMLTELGLLDEARDAFEGLAADGFDRLPLDQQWLVAMCLLAEAAWSLDDRERAARLYELLLPYGDRFAVFFTEISIGSVARYLGLLAASVENWDAAVRHFDEALELNERVNARPWLARTQADYGRLLLARGQGDDDRAHELVALAAATFRELGMQVHAEDAMRLARQRSRQ